MAFPLFVLVMDPVTPKTAFETSYHPVDNREKGPAPKCPTCGRYIGLLGWLPPHRAEIESWGKAFGDIAFGPTTNLLVSERFVLLWKEVGLAGLSGFDPVELVKVMRHGRRKIEPPPYFRVDVARSRAAIDQSASGIVRDVRDEPVCPDCRTGGIISRVDAISLEPTPPPVEDLFIARGLPGTILASERFETFCRNHNILNAVLIPAASYSTDPPKGRSDPSKRRSDQAAHAKT